MALWVDKYRPRELIKLDYHKEQAENLRSLCQQGDFPHLMFYGPSGAGKKTRITCLLRELYGQGVERLRNEMMTFTTPSNKKIHVMTVSSNYHLEVNPSEAGTYDRVVVIDLIKQVAQTHQIDPNGQREFKVIVLSEVDQLSKEAQHALRRTMEKYIATCRIILTVNSASRIIPAIRSRCLSIRVASPLPTEIGSILQSICKREGLFLPQELATIIIRKSERNLRRIILMLESCKTQHYPFTNNQEVGELDWQLYLKETANQIVSEQTPAKLEKIRDRLYELLAQGVPPSIVFKGLVQNLVENCDMSLKTKTIEFAAVYDHRMRNGAKHIFHLEAFVAQFMNVYKRFISDSMITDEF